MTKWEAGSELEDVNIKINTALDLMGILFDGMEDEMTLMHRINLKEHASRQAPLLSLLSVTTEKLDPYCRSIGNLVQRRKTGGSIKQTITGGGLRLSLCLYSKIL